MKAKNPRKGSPPSNILLGNYGLRVRVRVRVPKAVSYPILFVFGSILSFFTFTSVFDR